MVGTIGHEILALRFKIELPRFYYILYILVLIHIYIYKYIRTSMTGRYLHNYLAT